LSKNILTPWGTKFSILVKKVIEDEGTEIKLETQTTKIDANGNLE
tara:strand:- start:29373 stop:29507 length:135 start_codon:yes stop_codon:yes gene_type:complete